MRYITFLFIIITFGVAQIQYRGAPKYQSNVEQIKFTTTENLDIIDRDLHPMVLKYANQYFVDIKNGTTKSNLMKKLNIIFLLLNIIVFLSYLL